MVSGTAFGADKGICVGGGVTDSLVTSKDEAKAYWGWKQIIWVGGNLQFYLLQWSRLSGKIPRFT